MDQSAENCLHSNRGAAVLLVDEDPGYLEFIRRLIQGSGYSVNACNSYTEGIRQMESGAFDIIFVGQGSRNFEGRCVLECAVAFDRSLPVVVVARVVEMGCYLEAMQLGAIDYMSPSFSGSEITRLMHAHPLHRKSRASSVGPERSTAAAVSARFNS